YLFHRSLTLRAHAPPVGRAAPFLDLLLGLLDRFDGVLKGDDVAFLETAGHDDVVIVLLAHLNVRDHEVLALLDIHGRLAILSETGPRRDQQNSGFTLNNDLRRGTHTGTETIVQILERRAGGERLFRSGTTLEHQRRDRADPIEFGDELLVRDRVYPNFDL